MFKSTPLGKTEIELEKMENNNIKKIDMELLFFIIGIPILLILLGYYLHRPVNNLEPQQQIIALNEKKFSSTNDISATGFVNYLLTQFDLSIPSSHLDQIQPDELLTLEEFVNLTDFNPLSSPKTPS